MTDEDIRDKEKNKDTRCNGCTKTCFSNIFVVILDRIQVLKLFKKYYDFHKNANELLNQSGMVTSANIEGVSPVGSDFVKRETKSHECNKYILNIGNNTSDEWNYVLVLVHLTTKSPHLITHRIKVIGERTTSSVNIYILIVFSKCAVLKCAVLNCAVLFKIYTIY